MNWINSFEIICYLLTTALIIDIVRKKNWDELSLFFSAALAGFALEMLAVWLTGIYHYSSQYFISIGWAPNQFPFFGGLMWGGVAVAALRLAKKNRVIARVDGTARGLASGFNGSSPGCGGDQAKRGILDLGRTPNYSGHQPPYVHECNLGELLGIPL